MSSVPTVPTVKIPRAKEDEVAYVTSGGIGDILKKFERIDQILFGIMIAVVLSMVAIIVSVIGLFLDQMRYNNAAYKEYSDKVSSLQTVQDSNKLLLDENKHDQQLILDLQAQIQNQQKK